MFKFEENKLMVDDLNKIFKFYSGINKSFSINSFILSKEKDLKEKNLKKIVLNNEYFLKEYNIKKEKIYFKDLNLKYKEKVMFFNIDNEYNLIIKDEVEYYLVYEFKMYNFPVEYLKNIHYTDKYLKTKFVNFYSVNTDFLSLTTTDHERIYFSQTNNPYELEINLVTYKNKDSLKPFISYLKNYISLEFNNLESSMIDDFIAEKILDKYGMGSVKKDYYKIILELKNKEEQIVQLKDIETVIKEDMENHSKYFKEKLSDLNVDYIVDYRNDSKEYFIHFYVKDEKGNVLKVYKVKTNDKFVINDTFKYMDDVFSSLNGYTFLI